ncbi:hypothetical protein BGI41_06715 [Methanobrevibacter sp. 87.7]|uniref:AAA family ATPase n=1 Tax=Methanobrevibacter sp. 87.7 TaxID=387957 RepID=UPI000B50123D|nr:AAA family ATPase [Methanobrevibacter sp. 87.7]OWT32625.1 hypothetical protein BGI41_06715 [Methanobrevibacter sp. 87.7]
MVNVIGISGLSGSGKTLISTKAKEKGAIVVKMGDMVREEAIKRNEDLRVTSIALRKEHGKYAVANLTIKKVKSLIEMEDDLSNKLIIIEGIRSPYEVSLFKDNFNDFKVVTIFAPPSIRFERLKMRNRSDDSQKFEDFKKRDQDELSFGIGSVIAESDKMIINEGTLESFESKIDEFLSKYF